MEDEVRRPVEVRQAMARCGHVPPRGALPCHPDSPGTSTAAQHRSPPATTSKPGRSTCSRPLPPGPRPHQSPPGQLVGTDAGHLGTDENRIDHLEAARLVRRRPAQPTPGPCAWNSLRRDVGVSSRPRSKTSSNARTRSSAPSTQPSAPHSPGSSVGGSTLRRLADRRRWVAAAAGFFGGGGGSAATGAPNFGAAPGRRLRVHADRTRLTPKRPGLRRPGDHHGRSRRGRCPVTHAGCDPTPSFTG